MYRLASALVLMSLIQRPLCTSSDNLALLTGTLRTMQRAACDDELVSLACPWGTAITIQVAHYGKTSPGHNCQVDRSQSQPVSVEVLGSERCLWPNTMQYSLLQTVVEACQKKMQCKFSTQPKPGLVDPCPLARKFVEVAYKCRPHEFRIRAVCENDVIKLSCNPHSRVAVYEAQYGRIVNEPLTCPAPQEMHNTTCLAKNATVSVIQLCHGKRRCEVAASWRLFGTPCNPGVTTRLQIVYACVPLGVLTERYESAAERDEILNNVITKTDQQPGGLFEDDIGEKWNEQSVVPPAPSLANPSIQYPDIYDDETPKRKHENDNLKSKRDSSNPMIDSKTSVFVYIGIGILIFFVLTLLLVAVRCYHIRRSSTTSKSGDMFTTEAPNVFNDAVSDIDNDIEVAHISGTYYEHPDMILYRDVPGSKGTIRAMRPLSTIYPCAGSSMYGNVDFVPTRSKEEGVFKREAEPEVMVSPKTLARFSDSQCYYG